MSRDAHVAGPDAGIQEVARPFRQDGAARTLVHLGGQADGGDFEGTQVAAGVVEVAGHIRPTRGS